MINTQYKHSEYHRWLALAREAVEKSKKPTHILKVMDNSDIVNKTINKPQRK